MKKIVTKNKENHQVGQTAQKSKNTSEDHGNSKRPSHRWKYWWIARGQLWAMLVLAVRVLLTPAVEGREIDWASLPKSIVIWAIGGVLFGYMLKIADSRKKR